MDADKHEQLAEEGNAAPGGADLAVMADGHPAAAPVRRRRQRLEGAVLSTAARLPLVQLLDMIQPHVTNESVFHTRRLKIKAQLALAYEQLREEQPKRKLLLQTFRTMHELVREEMHDIHRDEVKAAAKEFVLATIKNAPAIISAAHQVKLLS